jgi:hypothetical protein
MDGASGASLFLGVASLAIQVFDGAMKGLQSRLAHHVQIS